MIVAETETGSQAEEGENYFISMTDMMVGVLFIFIIMLMVFALEFRTTTDTSEDALRKARSRVSAKMWLTSSRQLMKPDRPALSYSMTLKLKCKPRDLT
jgi:hypothetical protein